MEKDRPQMTKLLSSLTHKKFSLFCLCLIVVSVALKLIFMVAPAMPRDDDLYYWLWFQHPLFSYPDHPPLIGYLVGLSTLVFGHNTSALFVIGFLLYLALTILSYFLARNLFSPSSHLAGIILATSIAIVPYFAGIAVVMVPDTLMVFFIFLSLFAYHHAFFRDPLSVSPWITAGTLLALAFFSKLTVFFIGLAIFLYAFASKNRKAILSNYRFYLSFIPPTIIGVVLLISDASHDWIMMKYSSLRSSQGVRFEVLANFIYNQPKLYSPYFFFLFFSVSLVAIKKYYFPKNSKHNTTSEPLFFFAFLTLSLLILGFGKRLLNNLSHWWIAFAMLPGFIMILYYLIENWHRKNVRILSILNFSWSFFYISIIVFHTYFGVIDYNYKPSKNENPLVASYNILLRESALIFKKLGQGIEDGSDNYYSFIPFKDGRIKNYFEKYLDKNITVLAGNYRQMAYGKFFNAIPNEMFSMTSGNFTPTMINPVVDKYSLSDILFNSKSLIGQDIYFVFGFVNNDSGHAEKKRIKKTLAEGCGKFSELKEFPSYRKNRLLAITFIFHCQNYNGGNLTSND